jgi:hypothetical protein
MSDRALPSSSTTSSATCLMEMSSPVPSGDACRGARRRDIIAHSRTPPSPEPMAQRFSRASKIDG